MHLVYEWDEARWRANFAKHGVNFADMARFDWDTAVHMASEVLDFEQREVALGLIDFDVVVVCYTQRNEKTRIITLRKAAKREEKRFYASRTSH